MPTDNRAFIARYSRILRKKLASKVVVDFLMRRTVARSAVLRRWLHLYLRAGRAAEVPHQRLDNGVPARTETPIDAEMEAHLRTYSRGLEGCLAPGRLILAADVRVYALADCEILPWLGITLHRPSDRVIAGGIDAQPRIVFRKRTVSGRVISLLGSPRGHNHYYHFFEGLTLAMRALDVAGADEPVTVLVRPALSGFQRVTLEALVKRRPHLTLLEVGAYEIVQPERLILVEREPCPMICWFALIDEWREIGAMVRAAYGPAEGSGDRKILLSRRRQKLRRLANEEALEPVFERHGFEITTPETLPHSGQVHLIMQSRAIAGVEGAALTSLIFADQPLTLYLMCPREILNPFWEGLTVQMGHRFRYVDSGRAGWFDAFEVAPEALDEALGQPGCGALGA